MSFLSRVLKPLFWAALIFAYSAAVMPGTRAPRIVQWDKLEHMIAFFTLALLAGLAWRSMSLWLIGFGLAMVGLAIELTQAIPALNRDPSGADFVADCMAIVIGLGLAHLGRLALPWPRT